MDGPTILASIPHRLIAAGWRREFELGGGCRGWLKQFPGLRDEGLACEDASRFAVAATDRVSWYRYDPDGIATALAPDGIMLGFLMQRLAPLEAQPYVGLRVRFECGVERYPFIYTDEPLEGVIVEVGELSIAVMLDRREEGLEEWGNCVLFDEQARLDNDQQYPSLVDWLWTECVPLDYATPKRREWLIDQAVGKWLADDQPWMEEHTPKQLEKICRTTCFSVYRDGMDLDGLLQAVAHLRAEIRRPFP